jgi:hypothetical protein
MSYTGVAVSDPTFDTCFARQQLGYALDAESTVTQATSKSTAVTVNTSCGQITMNNAALAATTSVSFTLNNSLLSTRDVIIVNFVSGGTAGAYNAWVSGLTTGTATITLRNVSAGSLSEAVVLNFTIIHGQ